MTGTGFSAAAGSCSRKNDSFGEYYKNDEKDTERKPDKTHWEIERDDDGAYVLVGGFIDELVRNVVLSDAYSFAYFQRIIKEKGIIKELKKRGAKEGDTIRICDFDFEFIEDEE